MDPVSKRDLVRHRRMLELVARLNNEDQTPVDSLLASVAADSTFPTAIRSRLKSAAASEMVCVALDDALKTYQSEVRQDKDAFMRFCIVVRRKIDDHPAAEDLTLESRQALLGRYVDAALLGKRRAGRPSSDTELLFVHVWHMLNIELQSRGMPQLIGKVPRKEIAERCAREGLGGFTSEQVGKALSPAKRTFPCPYYAVKNTEN